MGTCSGKRVNMEKKACYCFFLIKRFTYYLRETEIVRESWGRVRGRERLQDSPLSLMWGSISGPWDHDRSRNQELGAWLTPSPRHSKPVIALSKGKFSIKKQDGIIKSMDFRIRNFWVQSLNLLFTSFMTLSNLQLLKKCFRRNI